MSSKHTIYYILLARGRCRVLSGDDNDIDIDKDKDTAERDKVLQRGSDAASRARVEPRRTRARDREREIGSQGSCSQLRARARENALSECINNVKHCFSMH